MRILPLLVLLPTAVMAAVPLGAQLPVAGPPDQVAVRQEFMTAMQRARQPEDQVTDPAELQAYVLYDYLLAARLQRDLDLKPSDETDAAIDAFLQPRGHQPVTRALRHEWLLSLAQRRRWDWFLPRAVDVSDPVLICDRLEGRLETADIRGLGIDALVRWNTPQQQPRECDGVFAWLHQQGLATPALAEVRTRAALAAENPRLAREFAAELPPAAAAPLLQWAQLLETPKPVLTLLARNPTASVEPDALDAGLNRLARTDSATALSLLPQILSRPDVAGGLRGRLQRDVALGAAYDRNPGALSALQEVPADTADDEVWQWRARAALWNGRFDEARETIERMPSSLAVQPRWRYWRARAIAATRGNDAAAALFSEVAGLRDYYGYLAADRVHQVYALNVQPSPDDQPAQAALSARPGLLRSRALFECGLWDDAVAEWSAELADADSATKIQAAHLAATWGWYAQAIATLAQSGEWNDVRLRYPRPYSAVVAQASALTQVPADWILAVMRQESLFRSDAVSRAGARGLMQLRPSTASAVARRWQLPPASPESLADPSTAVTLGAAYLREMLDRYGGQLGPALAAYNAGTAPVSRWLPDHPMDADIWIENIAYGETRDYVQRIFEHIVAFAWVRDAELPHLAALLPPVEPGSSSAAGISVAPVVPSLGALQ
ncbi:MAG: transglycosylase SLT domain-containing protein [Steroidobacteraceae bacterium]